MEMNVREESKPNPRRPSLAFGGLVAFLVLIAGLVYSPWVAPYGRYEPFILGLPYTLFWWMLLSLLLLVGIVLFAVFGWHEDDDKGGGE